MRPPLEDRELDRLKVFFEQDFKDSKKAIELAENYRMGSKKAPAPAPAPDPLDSIPPSLLSADDIARYVFETGMIHPFSLERRTTIEKPDGVHRLKGASYEGRIGAAAYIYDRDRSEPRRILGERDKFLTFPANSIVFVESDLYFRLPPFVAVRFNLQIRHVHRGLLLGTGPLVDPGFWGKLCIPIHNLTDEEYVVPVDEGLIWIEFTKVTSYPKLGEAPSNTNLDNIYGAIAKASQPYAAQIQHSDRKWFGLAKNTPTKVGIRSSISSVFKEAKDAARSANSAAKVSKGIAGAITFGGVLTVLGAAWVMHDLWASYRDATIGYEDNIRALATQTTGELASFKTELGTATTDLQRLQNVIAVQEARILDLQEKIEALNGAK